MRKQVLKHIGCICVVLALGLTLFNVYDTFRARKSEEDILAAYNLKNDLDPDIWIDPDMDMPEVELDGLSCIGTIEIPSLDIKLPVTSTFNYSLMKQAPCRYSGSVYKGNMVIAAHNSWFHFGRPRKGVTTPSSAMQSIPSSLRRKAPLSVSCRRVNHTCLPL